VLCGENMSVHLFVHDLVSVSKPFVTVYEIDTGVFYRKFQRAHDFCENVCIDGCTVARTSRQFYTEFLYFLTNLNEFPNSRMPLDAV
jgi:hypothetical protein